MGWFILILVLIIIGLLIYWVITVYNKLLALKNKYKEYWSNIDTKLKERFDLIPNLVEIVKSYAEHEKDTLEGIISARNKFTHASSNEEIISSNREISSGLKKLFAIAESYPELKANTTFLKLQDQLKSLEDDIATSRQNYNSAVLDYNNASQTFPTVLISGLLGYPRAMFFEATEEEKTNPRVNFK